jgi:hypothetical protein
MISVFLLLFFQIESCDDCSLFLSLFNFGFCWFSELIMFVVFLALVGSSIFCVKFHYRDKTYVLTGSISIFLRK